MPTNMRSASAYTLSELTSIHNQARADYLVPMQMTPDQLGDYMRRYDIVLDASCVAESEAGLPVGIGMLGLRDDRAWVTRLGVMLSHRHQGAGQAIVEWLVAAAKSRTVRKIQLEFIIGNSSASVLFSSYGFKPVRELIVLQRPAAVPLPPFERFECTPIFAPTCSKLLQTAVTDASWIEEARSISQSRGLTGFSLPGGKGWLIYCADGLGIEHVVIDPTVSRAIAHTLLCHLHEKHPGVVTTVENVPANSRLVSLYQSLDYAVAFRRTEMSLNL